MLSVTDLNVSVNGGMILNELNLEVQAGEVHAIMGPNGSGKSTLLNTILGFKRSETGIKAGTTSDIVEDNYVFKNKKFKILDTAGIAKKSIIKKKTINYFAILNSIKNIKNVDLVILLIDSTEGFDRQSKRIFNLMINKSSSITSISTNTYTD